MSEHCQILWCGQTDDVLVYVHEVVGDDSWPVGICRECARRLHLKDGDDLPEPARVKEIYGPGD